VPTEAAGIEGFRESSSCTENTARRSLCSGKELPAYATFGSMRTVNRILLAASLSLPVALASLDLRAEMVWEQDRVTTLAEDLARELSLLLEAARSGPQQDTAMQQRTRDAALTVLRRTHENAERLATMLREGNGHFATEGQFEAVKQGMVQALKTAKNAVAQPGAREHLAAAQDVRAELSMYYAAGA